MTIRGGGHPKPTMVLTPFLRMGPPPRSFAADAHDCIMVRPPLDLPNTRLWRDDPRPLASSPLIVDAQLSPNLVRPRLRQSPMTARAQQRGCLVVGVTEPTSRPGRQRSLRYTPKAGRKNSSGQVRNDGRGQVESHLGRNRLTLDA